MNKLIIIGVAIIGILSLIGSLAFALHLTPKIAGLNLQQPLQTNPDQITTTTKPSTITPASLPQLSSQPGQKSPPEAIITNLPVANQVIIKSTSNPETNSEARTFLAQQVTFMDSNNHIPTDWIRYANNNNLMVLNYDAVYSCTIALKSKDANELSLNKELSQALADLNNSKNQTSLDQPNKDQYPVNFAKMSEIRYNQTLAVKRTYEREISWCNEYLVYTNNRYGIKSFESLIWPYSEGSKAHNVFEFTDSHGINFFALSNVTSTYYTDIFQIVSQPPKEGYCTYTINYARNQLDGNLKTNPYFIDHSQERQEAINHMNALLNFCSDYNQLHPNLQQRGILDDTAVVS